MGKSTVQVAGPNFEGTYNVIVIEDHGVFGMSISLKAATELHKQLGALLEGKVKDQPIDRAGV